MIFTHLIDINGSSIVCKYLREIRNIDAVIDQTPSSLVYVTGNHAEYECIMEKRQMYPFKNAYTRFIYKASF